MKNQQNNIVSSGNYELKQAVTQSAFMISMLDWNQIKQQITQIGQFSSSFSKAASVCWGIFGSAVVALIPYLPIFKQSIDNKLIMIITVSVIVVSLVCSIAFSLTAAHEKTLTEKTKENVLEFMRNIDFRFENLEEKQ